MFPRAPTGMNATYMIVWGTNIPMTRSPDAHFYTEARYRGTKVVAVAPDYAEYVKFADTWLPAKAGTDGALGHGDDPRDPERVLPRPPVRVFHRYAKSFTDLPLRSFSRRRGRIPVPTVSCGPRTWVRKSTNGEWKTVLFDSSVSKFRRPQREHRLSVGGDRESGTCTWRIPTAERILTRSSALQG